MSGRQGARLRLGRRELQRLLRKLGACDNARAWCVGKTFQEAWALSDDVGWMLWLLRHVGYPKAVRVAIARIIDSSVSDGRAALLIRVGVPADELEPYLRRRLP